MIDCVRLLNVQTKVDFFKPDSYVYISAMIAALSTRV